MSGGSWVQFLVWPSFLFNRPSVRLRLYDVDDESLLLLLLLLRCLLLILSSESSGPVNEGY